MHDLIAIGRFAQITRLTIKALHIYDAMSLLCPVFVAEESGYRYYSITQLPLAHRIRLLRSMEMPLEAIREVLRAPTPAAQETLLHEHRKRLAARIAKDQQSLRLLQQLLDHQTDDMAFTVQLKELPAQLIASIHLRTTPAAEGRLIPALIDELQAYTTQLGIRCPEAPPLRISHEYHEDLVDTEIAVPVTRPVAGAGRITGRLLEGGPAAYVIHVGPHADLWAVYWAILGWMQAQGYDRQGPPRELYWMHPTAGQTSEYRTEVQWPVRLNAADEPGTDHGNA